MITVNQQSYQDLVSALKDLWLTVEKAKILSKDGNEYTEADHNFYNNWLVHLWQELKMARRLERRSDSLYKWFKTFGIGSGMNPDRPTHEFGKDYVRWVAEMTGDSNFPSKFNRARNLAVKFGYSSERVAGNYYLHHRHT